MENDGDIGLVLSGGGAKGAFQAGVWKAMGELGLIDRVRAISGTSVGALNAAAFAAVGDPEEICRFWRTRAEEVATPNLRNLSLDSLRRAAENVLAGKAFPFHGLLDRSVLEGLIRELMPAEWPSDAPEVVATSLECRGGLFGELDSSSYRRKRFRIGDEPDAEKRLQELIASAAIPWGFDPVEIDGRRYVDGGWDEKGGENVPATPILRDRPEIKIVVVVRCNSAEVDPEPLHVRPHRGTEVVEVRPSILLRGAFGDMSDLVPDVGFLAGIPVVDSLVQGVEAVVRQLRIWSGTFAFDGDCTSRFVRQGYADGLAALRHLRPKEKLNW